MKIQLTHLDGPRRGKTELRREAVVIFGTSPRAQVRYGPDSGVAAEHAVIRFHEAGCSFHLEALDGRVFVNDLEIREVILSHGDLIELGEDGPKIRFHIHAAPGEVCKPIRKMIQDAGQVRADRGLFRATTTLGRDFIFRSSWRVRVLTPLVLGATILIASFLGGHLATSSAARDAAAERLEAEESRMREIGALRSYINQLEAQQNELASRDEIDRIRGEIETQRELVSEVLADDRAQAEVIERYSSSVCLIHGIYGFNYQKDGKTVAATELGGSPLEIEYTGSGFLASADRVLTNRHVAEPWWENDEVERFLKAGFTPTFRRLDVYFPGQSVIAVDPATIVISSEGVDLAAMKVAISGVPPTPLEDEPLESFRGRHIVLLGYPTGVGALLARSERSELESIFQVATDLGSIISELAKRGSISPIITQGALNEVKEKRLVYDAATTSGGSGGPVFGPSGKVVGVNFAITRNFGGSNFGVPITFAAELLLP